MGKRIIQQRRGKGGHTYKVRNKASVVRPGYPVNLKGAYKVIKLIASVGHSTPIAKFENNEGQIFHNFAANHLYVGQQITISGNKAGDIIQLKELKHGTEIFNIENQPLDGGKFVRTGGNYATVLSQEKGMVKVMMPSKKEKKFSGDVRVTLGRASGHGRMEKPILKAGKKFFIMKSKSKLWPRTSAVAMNTIDHPFGSGRGKRIKSKIAKRNAAPGKKVGHIRPARTGRKKR